MNTKFMENIKMFANEFVTTIIKGNESIGSEYEWKIVYEGDYDEDENELRTKTQLTLSDDGEDIVSIMYEMVRDDRMRYSYSTTFFDGKFDGENVVNDVENKKEFKEIRDIINECEEGLYNKICAYLHNYAMEQVSWDNEMECEYPPTYEDYWTPSRVENFMRKFGVSKYVPIVMEVVDDKGMPNKYLSINAIYFNDEGNSLIVSLKED